MYRRPSKRKELIARISIYSVMILLIMVLVTALIFIILGYKIDFSKGKVTQDSLIQFASTPSGANVTIDGKSINSNTPTKSEIAAGVHSFTMSKTGYDTWAKTQSVQAGTLTWLNYALLVPKKLPVQSVASYSSVYSSLATPSGKAMLIEQKQTDPTYQLVDLTSDTIKSDTISIPQADYSDATTAGVTHTFTIKGFDSGGRYALIQHIYNDQTEWIVLDTQDPASSKNLTTLFDIPISDVHFLDTSGSKLYVLSNGDIRKLDTSAGTISRAYVSNVTSFDVYGGSEITYVATNPNKTGQRIVGLYRDGDESTYTLRTTTSPASTPLLVATANYFNDDYIAIAEGNKVDVVSGNYPSSPTDTTSLKPFASYTVSNGISTLEFSPSGEYIETQSNSNYSSYDLEYKIFAQSVIEGSGAINPLQWLNGNYLWSDRSGSLTIRELDGTNMHTINAVDEGQDVTLTQNGKYIYSIGTTKTGDQLQRVRMILQ